MIKTIDDRIQPLQDNIVLDMIDEPEKELASGIIVPKVADKNEPEKLQGKPLFGTVVAIGPGTFSKKTGERIPVAEEIELGQIIYINKWGGTPLMVDNKKYVVIREDEALLVCDKAY